MFVFVLLLACEQALLMIYPIWKAFLLWAILLPTGQSKPFLYLASPLGYVHIVPNEFPTGWKFARLGVLFKRYHANRYRMKFKPQAVQKANILSQCQ